MTNPSVFVVLVTYPYSGNAETIKVFAEKKAAREYVFESVKRYVEVVRAEKCEDDENHSSEWFANMDECVQAIENNGVEWDFCFNPFLEVFHDLDCQYENYSITESKVHTHA